jgi:hypothetical protein
MRHEMGFVHCQYTLGSDGAVASRFGFFNYLAAQPAARACPVHAAQDSLTKSRA